MVERDIFRPIPGEIVRGYTITYIMELIGSVLLLDGSDDCMSAIYVQFLGDMIRTERYSWTSAVLAYLYRNSCTACMTYTSGISRPLELLQIWMRTRFPTGRLRPRSDRAVAQHGGLWDEIRIDESDEEDEKIHVEDLPSMTSPDTSRPSLIA